MNKRQIGLELLKVDLVRDGRISTETLRYMIEHRINPYADDVKEVYARFQAHA